MKKIQNLAILLFTAIAVMGIYTSCKKTELSNNGEPKISYVRITAPESSDSLLVGAGQGRLIAIIGENLGKAVEIWFNDQKAVLTPTYITNTSILVTVPTRIPVNVNNKIKMIFSDGKQLIYDFAVQISKPSVTSMVSEFVNDGDVAIIRGDYFYAPITVTFTGGAVATLENLKDQEVQVRVPAGAQPGPITVKTNFGQVTSTFWFRDNRNHIIDGDPHEGWWATYLVTNPNPANGDPAKISGNYYRFKKQVKAWTWDSPEVAGGAAADMPNHSKNIPDDAILNPANYNVKFEINTLKPFNKNRIILNVGLKAEDNNGYVWQPPYDSKGNWNTITIPYEDMVAAYATKPTISSTGYWSRILIFGGDDLDADICFDNLRIVPKK